MLDIHLALRLPVLGVLAGGKFLMAQPGTTPHAHLTPLMRGQGPTHVPGVEMAHALYLRLRELGVRDTD
jgi:hypothetical protein